MSPITPRATYRLQLTETQPFAHAESLIPHLARIGVTHLYLSPILCARPGSRHFYDVADHSRIAEVLGGSDGLRTLATVAHDAGMGLIGDIVPNHAGIGPWNPRWETLLCEGRSAADAKFFDVDWEPPLPGATAKVIMPVLEHPYGEELEAGRLGLAEVDGEVRVTYGELSFPLNAETTSAVERAGTDRLLGTPGQPRTWSRMHSLLEQQHYRLVGWRAGKRLINYRRFHHIVELAALRVDDRVVFDATHALMTELVREGVLDGLRVDHLDGLADPGGYLHWLRAAVGDDAPLVVEVLADPGHPLPQEWPIDGTTGYELLRVAVGLHLDRQGMAQLAQLGHRHGALPTPSDLPVMKQHMMEDHLGPDLRRLVRATWDACQQDRDVRDVDYRTLLDALERLLVALPTPRTYVDPTSGTTNDDDIAVIDDALRMAADDDRTSRIPPVLWRYLRDLLTGTVTWTAASAEAVTRFQQLASSVTALGREERLFLRHNVMVAACELGCDPFDPIVGPDQAVAAIQQMPDGGLRTTATHDTRHSEDVRQRIAALSGMAPDWVDVADRLLVDIDVPDSSLALRLLQVVVGIWPITDDGTEPVEQVLGDLVLVDRLETYAIAAARGQDHISSFADPDPAAETQVRGWCRAILDPHEPAARALREVAVRAAEIGMTASLSQTVLRFSSGGVADTYQGTERWDDSLSDPDNRRDVDMADVVATSREWARQAPEVSSLWRARRDGRVKQWVLEQMLAARRDQPQVFGPGSRIRRCDTHGRWASNLLAFERQGPAGEGRAVAIMPVAAGRVTAGGRFEPLGRIWADTSVTLPPLDEGKRWHDLLSGRTIDAGTDIALADLLIDLPVSLLTIR